MARRRKKTAKTKEAGLWDYLREAFTFRWNMLLFLGGAVANKEGGWQDFILILIVTSIASTFIMVTFLYQDYKADTGDQRPQPAG